MHNVKKRLLEKHSFWFSLLCHLLLLLSFVVYWHPKVTFKPEPKPQMYIPSYTYQQPQQAVASRQKSSPRAKNEDLPSSPDGTLSKPSPSEQQASTISNTTPTVAKQASKNSPGIHLIGDDKSAPKPLIKLLARELASHLIYPKIAADFKVHGVTYVGFTIHPDGSITGVRLVQSSKASVLDQAAINAVTAMSPSGNDVAKLLKAEKFLVVGIIFG